MLKLFFSCAKEFCFATFPIFMMLILALLLHILLWVNFGRWPVQNVSKRYTWPKLGHRGTVGSGTYCPASVPPLLLIRCCVRGRDATRIDGCVP
jgi:hypothetical protein